jgi:hypothetical protein
MKTSEISATWILYFILSGCVQNSDIRPAKNQAPVITELSTTSGTPGTVFQLKGKNFDATLSGNEVRVGQNLMNVISASQDLLEVQIPTATAFLYGTFKVSVVVKGVTAFAPTDFTLINPGPTTGANVTGYVDKTSYLPGEQLKMFLDIAVPQSNYSIGIYDINQNLVLSATVAIAHQIPTSIRPWSVGFGYSMTASMMIPQDFPTGFYLIEKRIPLIVKPSKPVDIVVVYPSNTENAYSDSGGRSLYSVEDRPSEVSILRPIPFPNPSPSLNFSEEGIKWLKAQFNLRLGYVCDYDLEDYGTLRGAKVLILIGHSEYWTRNARKNFDRFVEEGHHALILSGNTMWWQVRYSLDGSKLICYKDASSDPIQDPLSKTINWNVPSLGYSIISSIGSDFAHGGYGLKADRGWDGFKIASPNSPLLEGTGVHKGDVLKLPTDELDGAIIDGFDVEGYPILNATANNFYRQELIGFDKGSRGNSETIGTFIVLQRTSSSGVIVNTGTTDWCSQNGIGGQDQAKIKTITLNAIRKLLDGANVFSHSTGVTAGI